MNCSLTSKVSPLTFIFPKFSGILVLILFVLAANGAIKASHQLHFRFLQQVLRCPMQFFDSTPVGRLVNRFSKDMESIDDEMPYVIPDFLECFFESVFIIGAVAFASPYILTVIPGLLILYFFIQVIFIKESYVSCLCVSSNISEFM